MNASSESGLWAMRTVVTAPAGGALGAAADVMPQRYQSAGSARGLAALSLPLVLPLPGTVAWEPAAEGAVLEMVVVRRAVIVVGPDGLDFGHLEAALAAAAGLGDEAAFEADVVIADQAVPATNQRVQRAVMLLDHHAVAVRAHRDVAVDMGQAGVAARLRQGRRRHCQHAQDQGCRQQDAEEVSWPEIHQGSPFETTRSRRVSPDQSKGPARIFQPRFRSWRST